jgi:tetratricopeptide (TPR) repeat protein
MSASYKILIGLAALLVGRALSAAPDLPPPGTALPSAPEAAPPEALSTAGLEDVVEQGRNQEGGVSQEAKGVVEGNTPDTTPPGFFTVTEAPDHLELKTPYGTLKIPTGFGADVPYRMTLPLDELKKNAGPIAEGPKVDKKLGDPEKLVPDGILQVNGPGGAPGAPAPATQGAATTVIDDSDVLVVDANRLFNRRRYHEALTIVTQLLRKRPDYIRGWLMKGSLFMVQGHKELAVKAWRKAQEIDPQNPEVLSVLERYQ